MMVNGDDNDDNDDNDDKDDPESEAGVNGPLLHYWPAWTLLLQKYYWYLNLTFQDTNGPYTVAAYRNSCDVYIGGTCLAGSAKKSITGRDWRAVSCLKIGFMGIGGMRHFISILRWSGYLGNCCDSTLGKAEEHGISFLVKIQPLRLLVHIYVRQFSTFRLQSFKFLGQLKILKAVTVIVLPLKWSATSWSDIGAKLLNCCK